MERGLEYYLKLPYMIEVVPIPESEGGGYIARLPEIGKLAITGAGDTAEEAINDLEEAKRERFTEYLKKGVAIPEPEKERECWWYGEGNKLQDIQVGIQRGEV